MYRISCILEKILLKNKLLFFICIALAVQIKAVSAKTISFKYCDIILSDVFEEKSYKVDIDSGLETSKENKYQILETYSISVIKDGKKIDILPENSVIIKVKNADENGYVNLGIDDFVYYEALSLVDKYNKRFFIEKNCAFNITKTGKYSLRKLILTNGKIDTSFSYLIDAAKGAVFFGPVKETGDYTLEIVNKSNSYSYRKNIKLEKNKSCYWKYKNKGIISGEYEWKLYRNDNSKSNILQGGFGLCLD